VVSATAQPKGLDEYGDVIGGKITLKARALTAELTTIYVAPFPEIKAVTETLRVKGVVFVSFHFEKSESMCSTVSFDWGVPPDTMERIQTGSITLVELVDDLQSDDNGDYPVYPAGSLLLPTSEKDHLVRVGLFYRVKDSYDDVHFDGVSEEHINII
jgi:hypothetical protein